MNFGDFQDICKQEVLEYAKQHLDVTDNVDFDISDVYVVWYAKTLQNAKALQISRTRKPLPLGLG